MVEDLCRTPGPPGSSGGEIGRIGAYQIATDELLRRGEHVELVLPIGDRAVIPPAGW